MKVLEIADQLGIATKDLLQELKRMRLPVKNHMSVIEDRELERILPILKNTFEKKKTQDTGAGDSVDSALVESGDAERAQEPAKAESVPESVTLPPKPKTKVFRPGFLLKPQAAAADKSKQEAIAKAKAAKEQPTPAAPKTAQRPTVIQPPAFIKRKPAAPAPVKEEPHKPIDSAPAPRIEPAPKPAAEEATDKTKGKRRKKDAKQQELIVPTIEVMSFKELRKDIAERWKKRTKGKKGAKTEIVEEPPKRAKKIRPSFYVDVDTLPAVPTKRPKTLKKKAGQEKQKTKSVIIYGEATVEEFAQKIGASLEDVIAKLESLGEQFTSEQYLSPEYCEFLAEEFGVELEIIPESDENDIREFVAADDEKKLVPRMPVVTIMGHVDHGKTTLLDSIRKSDIASHEYGGITQHIGAYCVKTPKGDLVFLDTPGHAAFTAMRARGAKVTDIVILVVSADDGVMPQTIEAINHAKAANVPIMVAINKIDKPGANPERIKQDLMRFQMVSEDLGGDTIFAEVAARSGLNVEKLLEMIHIQAEVLEIKADPDRPAEGVVLETHMDPLRGVISTLLVQKGTLKCGDVILTGTQFGKIRVMMDDRGRPIKEAGPSIPVEIVGLTGIPTVGDTFIVLPDEKAARRIAAARALRRKSRRIRQSRHVTLENLHSYISDTESKTLNIILKGDVQGSLEAITQALEKLNSEKVKINILHTAVGSVSESDVNLADASDAIIIGFNVRPEQSVVELAQEQHVEIKTYRIIYELLDEVRLAMQGMLEPKFKEVGRGRAEVRQVFKITKLGNIAGCFVTEGEIRKTDNVRLLRDNVVVYQGKISSLRRVKDDVASVSNTQECGIGLENFNDVKVGDIIETFMMEEIPQEL